MCSRNLNDRSEHSDEKTARLHRLNIGPRLTLCFAFIILAMLVGNAVALWQFQIVRGQAERLRGVDQMLILVLQAHTNLMSFYERLDSFAHSEDTAQLVREAEPLRTALLEDSRRTRNAFSSLPGEVQPDPTLLPALEAIQGALPAQLEAITSLATSSDWEAVRLRLANQVRQLESSMSALVKNIDGEVGKQRAEALFNIEQAQHRILLVVPATAVLTLLFAIFLWRGVRTALRTQDMFGRFLAVGITSMIVVQAFINISVVLGMMPTKGIPLPLVSYGGSSLLVTLTCIGVLLNISKQAE